MPALAPTLLQLLDRDAAAHDARVKRLQLGDILADARFERV
jgi:hypothetical protein